MPASASHGLTAGKMFRTNADAEPCPCVCPRSGNRLIVVRLDTNSGPAVARNAGVWAAKRLGVRLVCFTDADCQPEVCAFSGFIQGLR